MYIKYEMIVHNMCARRSSYLLTGTLGGCGAVQDRPVDVNSLSASYQTLRDGRSQEGLLLPGEQPSRSVGRETVGRNASKAIELRHVLNRVWVPRLYVSREGNTSLTGRPTGVREHGMLSKQVGEPRRSGIGRLPVVATRFARTKFKEVGLLVSEFRSFHSSWEVG